MTKDRLKKLIGENIRKERVARNLSIDELSELLGLTTGFVGLIERGKRGATAYTLYQLSQILNISPDRLFENSPGTKSKAGKASALNTKRTKISSIVFDLNEQELDFVIAVVRGLKTMQNQLHSKDEAGADGIG